MFQRIFLALPLILLFFSQQLAPAQMQAPAKSYSAERFDQAITVQQDGSLLVQETIVFKFSGGSFTYVYRHLPASKTDGVSVLSAAMDGHVLPQGTAAGQVEIVNGDPLKVTWHFSPLSDQTHTFTLTYRDLGVVQKTAKGDFLNWEILPTEYDYDIRSSTTTIRYPEQAVPVDSPQITRGQGQVTTDAGQIIVSARDIRAGSRLEIAMHFRAGTLIATAPRWQQLQEQASTLVLPSLAGGLALFLLILFPALWQYSRYRRRAIPTEEGIRTLPAPPDELPPAIAGALLSPTSTGQWNSALATLFDLGRKGAVMIGQVEERKKWYKSYPDFLITLQEQLPDLRPYELGLLSILFEDKGERRTAITIEKFGQRYMSRSRRFTKPLKQEMIERGLIDVERSRMRMRMFGISLIVSLLTFVVGVTLVAVIAGPAGMWPLIFLPLAVGLAATVVWILWAVYAPLSDQGALEAVRWRAFSRYLKDVVRGREPVFAPETFRDYLIYATAFGLAEKWAKFFQQQGMIEVPPWFHSLARGGTSEDFSYFVVMMSASHSAGTSSSGGGGGGAAGGGASGAG
ncbi:MAG: DUF2207 domain-containing protein [Ktedonobacteraceae bacterium]|nr:DUF2207 domain-containing protein [Ktedonobacteraceae bacterium]